MHNVDDGNMRELFRGFWRTVSAGARGLTLFAAWQTAVQADVVGIGDIAPYKDEQITPEITIKAPDLPQFGGRVDGNSGRIVVGGTGQFVGGTDTGSLTIDIPADTDPLLSREGVIGGDATQAKTYDTAIGQVRILSLNSEWRLDRWLIVGGTGQGFVELIDGAKLRTAASTNLIANAPPDLIVGETPGSQGFVTLDGFGSQMRNFILSVGHGSTGRIEVVNRASLDTTQEAIIGNANDDLPRGPDRPPLWDDPSAGVGHVLLDGRGTRWNIGSFDPVNTVSDGLLTLGDGVDGVAGRGTLELRNEAFVRVKGTTTIGAYDNGFGAVFVNGQFTTLWSYGDLIVGNDDTPDNLGGIGELHVDNNGLIRSNTETIVGRRGLVEFAGGRLLTPVIANSGVIRGNGRIDSNVTNLAAGDIRNAAALANQREQLLFSGTVANSGLIESLGGEMEFQQTVTNLAGGQIAGRDAIFRFRGANQGLLNQGQMLFGPGDSDVFGSITNAATGEIAIAHGANVVFYDAIAQGGLISLLAGGVGIFANDMILTSSSSLAFTIRDLGVDDYADPQLQVAGDLTLGGVIDLSNLDFIPEVGEEFLLMSASNVAGAFSSIIQPSSSFGIQWEVVTQSSLLGTDYVLARALGAPVDDADFNGDGVVNGADFAIWEANFPRPSGATLAQGDADRDGDIDGLDLLVWQTQFGAAGSHAAAAAIPEPATLLFTLLAISLGCGHGRSRR
jgi:T5SS/PEP-CTERM-associated repeat protein